MDRDERENRPVVEVASDGPNLRPDSLRLGVSEGAGELGECSGTEWRKSDLMLKNLVKERTWRGVVRLFLPYWLGLGHLLAESPHDDFSVGGDDEGAVRLIKKGLEVSKSGDDVRRCASVELIDENNKRVGRITSGGLD